MEYKTHPPTFVTPSAPSACSRVPAGCLMVGDDWMQAAALVNKVSTERVNGLSAATVHITQFTVLFQPGPVRHVVLASPAHCVAATILSTAQA